MQTAALDALGLAAEWSYEAIEVAPENFASRIEELRADAFVGVNVTLPHKQAALELADRRSEAAAAIGAANTLSFGAEGIRADNTDASGLVESLPDPVAGSRALVLGAGGAARAAAWALAGAGAEVEVWNRTASRAAKLASDLGIAALAAAEQPRIAEYEVLVNATAIGLQADAQGHSEPSRDPDSVFKAIGSAADQLDARQVVVDLVYGKTETGLIRAAKDAGARTVDGLEILVRQGAASFRIWTGLNAPLATMRRAVQTSTDDSRSPQAPRTPPARPRSRERGRGDRA
jgi:shikimate dehydrogenase